MLPRLLLLYLLCLCAPAFSSSAAAQQGFPLSIETTLGARVGSGGTYVNRAGAALDLLLGIDLRQTSRGMLILGISGGVQGPVVSADICLIRPDGECAEDFPTFLSAGVLLGLQHGSAGGASARVLAGPAYYHSELGRTLGLQGRLEASTPSLLRTSLIASLRGAALPSFRGETLGITSVGLGLRIQ